MTTTHNAALFTELEALCAEGSIATRAGKMFGCPAFYVGRKMALSVYSLYMKTVSVCASRKPLR